MGGLLTAQRALLTANSPARGWRRRGRRQRNKPSWPATAGRRLEGHCPEGCHPSPFVLFHGPTCSFVKVCFGTFGNSFSLFLSLGNFRLGFKLILQINSHLEDYVVLTYILLVEC